jgi:hypothetical protein
MPVLQFAVAFAGAVQASQPAPHELTLIFTQSPLQLCVPFPHTWHWPPLQAMPLQLMSHLPQCCGSLNRSTHALPQAMTPASQPQVPHWQRSLQVCVRLAMQLSVSPGVHGPWPLQFDHSDQSPVPPLQVRVCVPQSPQPCVDGPSQA